MKSYYIHINTTESYEKIIELAILRHMKWGSASNPRDLLGLFHQHAACLQLLFDPSRKQLLIHHYVEESRKAERIEDYDFVHRFSGLHSGDLPKRGQPYWYIIPPTGVLCDNWSNAKIDKARFDFNNVFETSEFAFKSLEELKKKRSINETKKGKTRV